MKYVDVYGTFYDKFVGAELIVEKIYENQENIYKQIELEKKAEKENERMLKEIKKRVKIEYKESGK